MQQEDREHESQGHERVAHLVQVSLAGTKKLLSSKYATSRGGSSAAEDSNASNSAVFKVIAGHLIRSASLEGLWAGSQVLLIYYYYFILFLTKSNNNT
jgi:hypothetical protein